MRINQLTGLLAASALLAGCSSTPRPHAPLLAAPPADQRAFEQAAAECHDLMIAGKLDGNGQLASLGGAGGAGAAVVAAGAASTAAMAGTYGAMAAAGATIILLPFALIGGAYGTAKIKRNKKEKAVKQVMSGCLAQRGYPIVGWERLSKAQARKAAAEARARKAAATRAVPGAETKTP